MLKKIKKRALKIKIKMKSSRKKRSSRWENRRSRITRRKNAKGKKKMMRVKYSTISTTGRTALERNQPASMARGSTRRPSID